MFRKYTLKTGPVPLGLVWSFVWSSMEKHRSLSSDFCQANAYENKTLCALGTLIRSPNEKGIKIIRWEHGLLGIQSRGVFSENRTLRFLTQSSDLHAIQLRAWWHGLPAFFHVHQKSPTLIIIYMPVFRGVFWSGFLRSHLWTQVKILLGHLANTLGSRPWAYVFATLSASAAKCFHREAWCFPLPIPH